MIGGLVMLALTSAKLTLMVLVGVPLTVVPIILFGRRVRKLARASQDRVGDVGAYVDEALHEIRTVQAYGHEDEDRRQFGARVESAFATALQRIRQRAFLVATVILLVFGAVGVILWIGGHDVVAGRISAGQLSAFVFYAVIVASAVGTISEVIGDLQRAAGATERLFELLEVDAAIRAPADPTPLPVPARGTVAFRDVTFHYPSRPDTAALRDFSLDVAAGEKVALVGPSGAGKTTVFQLLLRFYDPQRGAVTIDGVDLRAADPADVARRLAVVPQDPVIFAASVLDNVRYGRPDATEEEVRAACDAAYATEFIERIPEGFDSYLGERGVRLSGGQRQRIAIARAILADRPVLLLDEATSALDAESERMVQLALERLMAGRTVLIIAHRLATVRHADRIAVMEHGRIIATGHARRAHAVQSALCAAGGAAIRCSVRRAGQRGGRAGRARGGTMIGSPPLHTSCPKSMTTILTFPNSPYELHQPFEPAGDQPEAIDKLVEGLDRRTVVPDAARCHRIGQDVHDGQRHRAHRPPGDRDRAEQDARRAALLRIPRVLPAQRGRVLRLVLRLLPAGSVRPVARSLHREGFVDQRAHRADAAVGDQGDPRAAGLRDRGHGIGDLRHRRSVRVPQHDPAPEAGRQAVAARRDQAPDRDAIHAQRRRLQARRVPRARRRARHLSGGERRERDPRLAVRRRGRDAADCSIR